jgi:hypothetical protein
MSGHRATYATSDYTRLSVREMRTLTRAFADHLTALFVDTGEAAGHTFKEGNSSLHRLSRFSRYVSDAGASLNG